MFLQLNCVLMLNWIVWNGTVFDIETVLYTKLNCLKYSWLLVKNGFCIK